eukprot:TRINITY_DN94980_c0_g1_i1.p1 TRINITY_DN94980_c0_g1~~TRINITY_DN94980_c0_g1_i1.p1  ORF type:complete len:293 (-),score=59.20 TRINITY_DN94980_c0_g1_i1:35-913(-)
MVRIEILEDDEEIPTKSQSVENEKQVETKEETPVSPFMNIDEEVRSAAENASSQKEQGNKEYKNDNVEQALEHYNKAVEFMGEVVEHYNEQAGDLSEPESDPEVEAEEQDPPKPVSSRQAAQSLRRQKPKPQKCNLPPNAKDLLAACYGNCASCYVRLGAHTQVVSSCNSALELKPDYVKVLQRRATAHQILGDRSAEAGDHTEASGSLSKAMEDWKAVAKLEPTNKEARAAISKLQPQLDAEHEKMKEEMMGKLKDVGNSVLGWFGLSVDNFKTTKDPETGAMSISFQNNK